MRALIIVPTYNEIENISQIIAAVLALPIDAHMLIVDDNSPDGTAARVTELQSSYPDRLHLLKRKGKLGLGTAYIAGFQWGIDAGYGVMCELDADFSHNPNDIPRLIQALSDDIADVAIGSRYIQGFGVKNWPLSRILLSYCASLYVRIITWMPVRDATAGFVCYKTKVLEDILLYPISMKGYGFQIEMKYLAYRLGYRIKELPIVFIDRERGSSKMSGGIFSEALRGVIRLRLKCPVKKRKSEVIVSKH